MNPEEIPDSINGIIYRYLSVQSGSVAHALICNMVADILTEYDRWRTGTTEVRIKPVDPRADPAYRRSE